MKRKAFVLLTDSQPRSLNAKNSGNYVALVRKAAFEKMGQRPKLVGSLVAQIVWFHRRRALTDADNIAKRHLDGLRSIVFVDDVAISRCSTERVSLQQSFVLDATSLEDTDLKQLLEMIGDSSREHVVFTQITQAQISEIELGRMEE